MKGNQEKARIPAWEIAGLIVVTAVAVFVSGCQPKSSITYIFGKNHIMEGMDLKYSYNVTTVPKWWPDEDSFDTEKEAIGDTQKQYYAQHGEPDYFRLYYNKSGSVLPREAVSAHKGMPKPQGVSWIYLDREVEVTFEESGAEEEPLTDEIRALCELGDPDEIKNISQDASVRHVRYIYRQEGSMIDFVDGKKDAVQATKPMPGWIR